MPTVQVGVEDFDKIPEQLTPAEEAEIDRMVLPLPKNWTGDFDGIRQRNYLRILVPYSKTFYRVDRGIQQGIDYDYGKALETWLKKKYPPKVKSQPFFVAFIPVQRDQLLPDLIAGKGDIAMGGLTVTDQRLALVDFTTPFADGVREALVTVPGFPEVTNLEGLAGKEIMVRGSSSYYEHLTAINEHLEAQRLPSISIIKADEWLESEDLLEMVNAGLIRATVVDRYLVQIWAPLFTEMQVNDSVYINKGGDLAWAIRKNSPQLKSVLADFMKEHRVGTTFGNIMVKRHVRDNKRILNATSEEELLKFRKLVDLFRQHGINYNFDYLMLVAQGYQESMLNQKARSHRGAVGIMQLLPATAADPAINIRDIDKDAGKNIEAGAKYLRLLTDKYLNDAQLDPVNKTLMAFAAYNAGPGNLRKFRRLAEKSGNNPNIWFQNVEYAAARIVGEETVKYVANIYKYYVAYKLALQMRESRNGQVEQGH
ncbi:MltF family protein [Desulfopila aestuarii]|nr:lytic transglycosylase F [Desulfopila aestuarii]